PRSTQTTTPSRVVSHLDFELAPFASEDVRERLNGKSFGHAKTWQGEQDGDYVHGKVTQLRERQTRWHGPVPAAVVVVEEGAENGKSVEAGSHRLVFGARVGLREMFDILKPRVGDILTVARVK